MTPCGPNETDTTLPGTGAGGDDFLRMGLMYASGRNVPLDLVSAHAYLAMAAAKGVLAAAAYRRDLAAEMSRAEIVEAQRRAREWLARH